MDMTLTHKTLHKYKMKLIKFDSCVHWAIQLKDSQKIWRFMIVIMAEWLHIFQLKANLEIAFLGQLKFIFFVGNKFMIIKKLSPLVTF